MITESRLREIVRESLRDWFKKEDWVKINTAGTIEGPCGTMDKKEPTDRDWETVIICSYLFFYP